MASHSVASAAHVACVGACAVAATMPAGCNQQEDCASHELCLKNMCTPGCETDDNCGRGKVCRGRKCRKGCNGDEACEQGQICVSGSCKTGCKDDTECGLDEICRENACQPGACSCRAALRCHVDERCLVWLSSCDEFLGILADRKRSADIM